ncbi:ABC transporter ATP-binding protein, partial [Microvirga pakistanensis]|uniref:ABC transporter ATP-binding protein n=1 Tax=Microvirga pakistanensis TaxID=1682650 RepID=UPI001FCEE10F
RVEIKELHQRLKTTTIYVTHDQIEAMTMADKIVVMHDGIVEQIGAPLELYDRPRNLFVAGFIGSPAMNFIEGQISVVNGRPQVRTEDGIELPVSVLPKQVSDGQKIVYGLRPEHIALGEGGQVANVSVIEPTGSETQAFMRLGSNPLVGVFRERIVLRPGERLGIRLDADKAHLFDKMTGQRLS